ncbi:HAMP domain-containing histidine kinase [bacterium]|nr:HAMP domain-containing histidine kinase [bacterium]
MTPIVLLAGADASQADLARTLGDAGYPVIAVPQTRQLAVLAASGALGPVVVDLAACEPAAIERLRRAVASAGGLLIGISGGLSERERRRLRRRYALFAIHDPGDGLERFLELVDTAVDVGRDQQRRRAEHAVRVTLLAKLCHDLRANLDVINGYVDVLGEETDGSARARGAVAGLRKAGRQSHELVDTYAALAHCDAEHLAERREPIDVRAIVAAVRRHVELRSRYAPCALLAGASPAAAVRADREKLHAMLTHLVDAALKRSADGVVTLRVTAASDAVVFDVASSADAAAAGVRTEPLALDAADELFETPDQILALTIAQRFGQLLGATVEARPLDTGILFRVALPFTPPVLRALPARGAAI